MGRVLTALFLAGIVSLQGQDTIKVELTELFKKELLTLEQKEKQLEEQYKSVKQAILSERNRLLIFIADRKNIKAENIAGVIPLQDSIGFIIKDISPAKTEDN